ncbi:phosphatase PAP2 family protein [Mucilaginibacter sp. AW1-3]
MIEQLKQLDHHLFYLVNHGMGNSFFDWLMPGLRNPLTWIPLYICIIGFCIYSYKKTGLYLILMLIATVGAADFSSNIVKHSVKRLRPCNSVQMSTLITTRVPCGSGFSFTSSHACDHFAIAVFLGAVFYKRRKWLWIPAALWAAAICFAQVYVGLHYPADVFAGALLGTLIALLFAFIFKKLNTRF